MPSNFAFLRAEWPEVYEAATKAWAAAHPDPRTACFYARRALELAVAWAYKSVGRIASPLVVLERMLTASGIDGGHLQKAKEESHGLGLFVRSLVGLDREAAKQAFAGFLAGKALTANQIEFVNLVVNHLTEHGVMSAALLYESPFTDVAPRGPDEIFAPSELDELLAVLDRVRATAIAA